MEEIAQGIQSLLSQMTEVKTQLGEETAQQKAADARLEQLEKALAAASAAPRPTLSPDPTPQSAQTQAPSAPIVNMGQPMTVNVSAPKMATPKEFDGLKGQPAETFANQVGLYIMSNPTMFPNNMAKLSFALLYMTGQAGQWAAPYLKKILHGKGTDLPTWDQFGRAFEASFFDSDKVAKADVEIRALQQKGTVAAYSAKFKYLASIVGWEESTLVANYRAGLKSEVHLNMIGKVFASVDKIDAMALSIDNELHSARSSRPVGATVPQAAAADPNAMDLSAARFPISRDEYRRRQEEGACFKCGEPGHIAKGCTGKKGKGKAKTKVAELEKKGEDSPADDSKNGKARD